MTLLGVSGDGFRIRLNKGNRPILMAEELNYLLGWGHRWDKYERRKKPHSVVFMSLGFLAMVMTAMMD